MSTDYEYMCPTQIPDGDDLDTPMPDIAYKPLTALQKAALELSDAESKFERAQEGSAFHRSAAESAMTRAAVYAAVAQASALERIAAALEIGNRAATPNRPATPDEV